MKIIIPLQTCSTRVRNKNLRNFIGKKSLFDIKAEQILKVFDPNKVFVSSELLSAKKQGKKYLRNKQEKLCLNLLSNI